MKFFKKEDNKIEKIGKQILLRYEACNIGIDKNIFKIPRPQVGSILFFLGSIDNLCQANKINDKIFAELSLELLDIMGFKKEFTIDIFKNFYTKHFENKFALKANIEGGKLLTKFLSGEDKTAPLMFKNLLNEWRDKPDLDIEDLYLFGISKGKEEILNLIYENKDNISIYERHFLDLIYLISKQLLSLYNNNLEDIVCKNCGEIDKILALKGKCLNCGKPININKVSQFIGSLEYLYYFMIYFDEININNINKNMEKLEYWIKWTNHFHEIPNKETIQNIKDFIINLEMIGGNNIGGAIKISKDGKLGIQFISENIPEKSPDILSIVSLGIKYLLDFS